MICKLIFSITFVNESELFFTNSFYSSTEMHLMNSTALAVTQQFQIVNYEKDINIYDENN